ncbi:MAG: hypothetical protein Q8P27_02325 [Candidatus Peregrinibacteria bacterium]|nr:hypothetical protein [Candidatus Peregrinibacteria bacterium]
MDYKEARQQINTLIKAEKLDDALQLTLALRKVYWNDGTLHTLINSLKVKIRKNELNQRKDFVQDGAKTIKKLYGENEFEQAIMACSELIDVDPDNVVAKKYLHKAKMHLISEKLKDPLQKKWTEEGEYEKLYLFYQKLKKVFPKHSKLNRLIKQTERKMIQKDRDRKKVFAEEGIKKLQEMFTQGKYETVIAGAKDLITYTHEGSDEAKKILTLASKLNRKEIERDTYKFMLDQKPLLRAIYKEKIEPMIKI